MMARRRQLVIAVTGLLVVGGGLWFALLRPVAEPSWTRHLRQYGGEFHTIPGSPQLSVCYFELRIDRGMMPALVQPAVVIRNEGWGCRLSEMTLRASENATDRSRFPLMPLSYSGPAEWDSLRPVESEIRISGRSYALILCEPLDVEVVAGDSDGQSGGEALELELIVDSEPVTISGVSPVEVEGHAIGLIPVLFDLAVVGEIGEPAV